MFKGYPDEMTAEDVSTGGILDELEVTVVDDPNTRYDVLLDGIEAAGLSAIEASVVELVGAGFGVARMVEIIPEESVDIHRTIDTLVERGVLRIRGADDGMGATSV